MYAIKEFYNNEQDGFGNDKLVGTTLRDCIASVIKMCHKINTGFTNIYAKAYELDHDDLGRPFYIELSAQDLTDLLNAEYAEANK